MSRTMITCAWIWTKPCWSWVMASMATSRVATPTVNLNIMSYETLTNLRGRGFYTEPGQMGEQIVIHQLDVDNLPPGSRVQLGDHAVIEVIKQRTGCEKFERLQRHQRTDVAGEMGVMAKIIIGGKIHVGDPVKVLEGA